MPTTGYMTRVFASAFEMEQGRRLPSDPGGPPPGTGSQQGGITTGSGEGAGDQRPSLAFGWPCRDGCVPDLPGQLQRYMVYVPAAVAPADGYSSLVWTNGYALRPGDDVAGERDLYQQFAEREGNPTMVIDVDGRGQDQWGYGQSGASIFEAVADARRHYVTLLGCDRTESFDGSGPGLESYDPIDPLGPLGNPAQGAPIPAEVGNAPQPPLTGIPPLRFPPNAGG